MVIIISKKEKEDKANEAEEQTSEEQLTPWQKANLQYLKEKGDEPTWSPAVIDGQGEEHEESEEPAEAEPTETNEQTEETSEEVSGEPANGSFADRLPKLKMQRDSLLYRRLTFLIILFSIPLLFTIYYVSPLSKLAKVTVTGNRKLTTEAVLQAADFKLQDNLWSQFFHREKNQEKLEKAQPRIKRTRVAIENFNQFHLTVTEYREVAMLAKGNEYSPILENGQVMDETLKKDEQNLPILEDFKSEKKILAVLQNYQKLTPKIRSGISQIKYTPTKSNDELLKLYMNDGNQVIVNISNLTQQMRYYPQVANDMKEKGVVDMEVGIFTYPYPKEDEETTTTSTEENTENNQ